MCFNPRAPCGARHVVVGVIFWFQSFQSTRPMRGATVDFVTGEIIRGFQSTRPMRGATFDGFLSCLVAVVSIHAPHAGRDTQYVTLISSPGCFNPRAPCGARRPSHNLLKRSCGFNPRAPCGARLRHTCRKSALRRVSIHAPHAGRDVVRASVAVPMSVFQSTRPMRGATFGRG